MAGDKVQLNVANYYDGSYNAQDDQPVTADNLLGSIVSVLTGGAGGLGTSESHNPELVPRLFNSENYAEMDPLMHSNADPTRPKAFLNYVLFDASMQVVRTFTGAFQANGNGGWQTIGNTEPMTIPENGYLAVYLSNASDFAGCSSCLASEGDVYFDHLEITFTHGHLKEENGYYPFGLPMAGQSSSALGMTPNRQKYQSNEYITEAGLNWMSFGARQYDPQLGRFLSVDPLAAAGGQESNSPYEAMGDEPVSGTDPGGMLEVNSSVPPSGDNVRLGIQFAQSTLDIIFGSGSMFGDDENTSDVLDNTDWGNSGNTASAESMGIDIAGIFIDIDDGGTGFSSGIAMDEGPGGAGGDGGGDAGGGPDGKGNRSGKDGNAKDAAGFALTTTGDAFWEALTDGLTAVSDAIVDAAAATASAVGTAVGTSTAVAVSGTVGLVAAVLLPEKIGDNSEEIKSIHSHNMNPKDGIPGRGEGGNDRYLYPIPKAGKYLNGGGGGPWKWLWPFGVGGAYGAYKLHQIENNGGK